MAGAAGARIEGCLHGREARRRRARGGSGRRSQCASRNGGENVLARQQGAARRCRDRRVARAAARDRSEQQKDRRSRRGEAAAHAVRSAVRRSSASVPCVIALVPRWARLRARRQTIRVLRGAIRRRRGAASSGVASASFHRFSQPKSRPPPRSRGSAPRRSAGAARRSASRRGRRGHRRVEGEPERGAFAVVEERARVELEGGLELLRGDTATRRTVRGMRLAIAAARRSARREGHELLGGDRQPARSQHRRGQASEHPDQLRPAPHHEQAVRDEAHRLLREGEERGQIGYGVER